VLAIIAVVTAITVPNLARSIRGNRLRVATRGIVMAGRYARSMAVLRQEDLALTFDLDAGEFTVGVTDGRAAGSLPSGGVQESASDTEREFGPPHEDVVPGTVMATSGQEVKRRLDGVRIESVEVQGAEEATYTKGRCSVLYRNNGTCTPYRVRLVEDGGAEVTVDVDALSSPRTEGEG
jgi:Tfp pilus assembly protein FimT